VHKSQLTVAGRQGLSHDHRRQFSSQALAQAAVFRHRKAVTAGQGQNEMVGVEGVHGGARKNSSGDCGGPLEPTGALGCWARAPKMLRRSKKRLRSGEQSL
jgi:hypothetical protein